jgi:hypothetical protein
VLEVGRDPMDGGNDFLAPGNGQSSTVAEVVLNVDDDQDVTVCDF